MLVIMIIIDYKQVLWTFYGIKDKRIAIIWMFLVI